MHPLVARIHPGLRTAFFAWFFSRSFLWVVTGPRPLDAATPTPFPALVDTLLLDMAGAVTSEIATGVLRALPWVATELLLLVAGVAVYRFARSTKLPQLAERACWLWFFNPVLALTVLDWGAGLAAATGALALGAVVTHRPRLAAVAAIVAVGCRPEFGLLGPAIAIAAWRHHRPDKEGTPTLAAITVAVPLAFSAWIGVAWHLAGSAGTSLRALHGDGRWRTTSDLIPSIPVEALVVAGLLAAAGLAIRYLRRVPIWYVLCALPAIAWPLTQVPAQSAALALAWSLPTFVHLGMVTDDRSIERPLIAALVMAFVLAGLTI